MWCCFRAKKVKATTLELEPFGMNVVEEKVQEEFNLLFNTV